MGAVPFWCRRRRLSLGARLCRRRFLSRGLPERGDRGVDGSSPGLWLGLLSRSLLAVPALAWELGRLVPAAGDRGFGRLSWSFWRCGGKRGEKVFIHGGASVYRLVQVAL